MRGQAPRRRRGKGSRQAAACGVRKRLRDMRRRRRRRPFCRRQCSPHCHPPPPTPHMSAPLASSKMVGLHVQANPPPKPLLDTTPALPNPSPIHSPSPCHQHPSPYPRPLDPSVTLSILTSAPTTSRSPHPTHRLGGVPSSGRGEFCLTRKRRSPPRSAGSEGTPPPAGGGHAATRCFRWRRHSLQALAQGGGQGGGHL